MTANSSNQSLESYLWSKGEVIFYGLTNVTDHLHSWMHK